MTLHPTTPDFKDNAHRALHDPELQKALGHVQHGFIYKRQSAVERLPEFETLREAARDLALQVMDAFSGCDYIVAPSGSCTGQMVKHFPELFDEPQLATRARAFAAKTFELVS